MQGKETEHLVKKAMLKDPDAFTELMQLHLKDMYRTALAILMNDEDAADAIQDTILACWEKLDRLKEALASLDEKYRVAMTLFYSEGYSIDEIAKILKIPKTTVQTRLHRGRKKLARDYYGIQKGEAIL